MERYKLKFREKRGELYIKNSSWFDTHKYDVPKIIKALKKVGAKNIYTDPAFGWSNQPEVVVFSGVDKSAAEQAVGSALGTQWIIAEEKDW